MEEVRKESIFEGRREQPQPKPEDIHRFRALGRTQMVGRNPDGSITSKEGLAIQEAMEANEAAHRLAKQEEQ